MNWLTEIFTQPSPIQTLLVLAIIAATGLALGKLKLYGISLGITFVFFAGIMAGHLGIEVNRDMLRFAQDTGLVIFVYTLGLQVGPGFFSSFKKGGVKLNLLGLAVVIIGFMSAILASAALKMPVTDVMGLFAGAVTNTPMLGAAQQAALQVHPEVQEVATDMALACAVGYPVGVIGMIAVIIILKSFNRKSGGRQEASSGPVKPFIAEFHVSNPAIFGKNIKEIMSLTESKFVISRVWRQGKVSIPTSDTVIMQDDHLLVISTKSDTDRIRALFGEKESKDWNKEDIDWNAIDSRLISKRILVTRQNLNGVKLGSLKLRNIYGINITRVNRAGIDLLATRKRGKKTGRTESHSHIHRAGSWSRHRKHSVQFPWHKHSCQTGYRRRSYNNRHTDGSVRSEIPYHHIYHTERKPDAQGIRSGDIPRLPGTRCRREFLRNGILHPGTGMDRTGSGHGHDSDSDSRICRTEVFPHRLS